MMCYYLNVHFQGQRVNKIYLKFLGRFSKNTEISSLTKICPTGAALFHADVHDKANSGVLQILRTRLKTNPILRCGQVICLRIEANKRIM